MGTFGNCAGTRAFRVFIWLRCSGRVSAVWATKVRDPQVALAHGKLSWELFSQKTSLSRGPLAPLSMYPPRLLRDQARDHTFPWHALALNWLHRIYMIYLWALEEMARALERRARAYIECTTELGLHAQLTPLVSSTLRRQLGAELAQSRCSSRVSEAKVEIQTR